MKRISNTFFSPIDLDHDIETPIYQQLYGWIRSAILNGHLRPGQRVPSTRGLAAELKVSRIPVLNAYEQLLAEGYLQTAVGSGTFVARLLPDDSSRLLSETAARQRNESALKRGTRRISQRGTSLISRRVESGLPTLGAFRVSLPALDHFPIGIWSKLVF